MGNTGARNPQTLGGGETDKHLIYEGLARVSAEAVLAGLAAELIDAALVQDLYLTTSPLPGGEPGTPIYPRPLDLRTVVRKRGTLHEAGVLFEHSLLPPTSRIHSR